MTLVNGNGSTDVTEKPTTKIDAESLEEHGFLEIEDRRLESNPPRIKWGEKFEGWTDDRKIIYLKRLASTMNHAAYTLQTDLYEMAKLHSQKEAKLVQMAKNLSDNNALIQSMATSLNEERQGYNAGAAEMVNEIKALKLRVKELEGGDND